MESHIPTVYPLVPGHEIVGHVAKIGHAVTKFKEGDLAAVGCMVDSCRTCDACQVGLEIYCQKGEVVLTYNGPDKHLGRVTYGGYSESIVVDERFVLHVPRISSSPAPLLFFAPVSPPQRSLFSFSQVRREVPLGHRHFLLMKL